MTIRIILDNHSAHVSKETRAYLASKSNRFKYVHTPKHGSWLNLVETLFGKMAHTFLKQIRVKSKEELKERILKGYLDFDHLRDLGRGINTTRLSVSWCFQSEFYTKGIDLPNG